MRWSTLICFMLFLMAVALGLLQMWFHPWDPQVLGKILITDVALMIVFFIWGFLVRENRETKKIEGDGGNSLS
jgi:membrane protein YdbS with pleckstrin-like domain